MRIIHVTDSSILNFDGISTYINELILGSENRGDEVMLLCTTPTVTGNLRPINYKGVVKTYRSLRFPGKPKLILPIKFGITKRPEHLPVFLNIDFHQLNESDDKFFDRFSNFTVGAEFLMSKSLRLRVGYNNKQRKELKTGTSAGLGGFSLGAGLVLKDYQIDYSYNSYGVFGGIQRFSLGINL